MRSSRLLSLLGAAICIASCGGAEPPPFKPVVDNKLLMSAIIDPNADIVWDAVKWIETREGTEEIRPRTEDQWAAVRNAAITVAESGNLLMIVPRAKNSGEWMQLSQRMIDMAQEAIKAADAKNADRLFTVGGDLYETCTACHAKYDPAIVNANQ
jgi:hypothetical protein